MATRRSHQGRVALLIKDLINFCWFVFKWGIVPGTIAALVAVLYFSQRVDEEIRCQVEDRVAEHYPDFKVTVRSAVRIQGEGIEIRDLSISQPGAEGPSPATLHLQRVFLRCNTDLVDLIGDDVCVDHITIQRPTLRLARLSDGTWTGRQFWPPPKFSEVPPNVTIENGTVEIVDLAKSPPSTMTFRDVNLTIENQPSPDGDPSRGPIRVVRGTLTGDHLGQIKIIKGQVAPDRQDWSLVGMIHDLEVSPELRAALPTPLAGALAALAGFRGHVQLGFEAVSDPAEPCGCRFTVKGRVTEGRVDDPRLPCMLTNIRGSISADNNGFVVKNLFARGGRSTLWISRGQAGFGPRAPWSVQAKVTRLTLDGRLLAALPESMQALWDKYKPAGEVDINVKLKSDGRRLDLAGSRVTVDCKNVAFTYHKFPYRLHRGRGKLELKDDTLFINMTAHGGNRPVRLSGQIKQPLVAPHGWFKAHGENFPVDVNDEKLLGALNEKTRPIVRSLAPRGLCDFQIEVWRNHPADEPLRHIVLDFKDTSICFDKFPCPVQKIRGRIERFADGRWEFRDLVGTNDTAQIWCNGRLVDGPVGKQLSLVLRGKDVLLDEELRDALKPSMRKAWNDLEPRGVVDFESKINWLVGPKTLDLVVEARPQPETTSIKPRMFPCHMERLQGTLVYRDGHVTFERFRARHGRTTISGQGHWNFQPEGSWDFHLENVSVDRLRLDDRELVQALPERLRKGLARLNPSGPMSLHHSTLDVRHSGVAGEPVQADWDLRLSFDPGRIECGICLENINGQLSLRGGFDGRHFHSLGELDIDSLTYKGLQFTHGKGPVWIDDGRILLGSWVARRQPGRDGLASTPPRPLSAELFGGTVKADAWIAPKHVPCYALNAELLGADLAQFAKERMAGRQDLRGRVGLVLNLEGLAPTINGLKGRGRVWLRDGNVYELPLMITILKMLTGRPPDTTAFSDANIQFQIAANHIYLKPIEFNGDAISLVGQGQMDFQSNVDLAFYAVVGRNEWYVPLVSPIMSEASKRTMTINVRGPLQKPEATRDVLPGVREALRELENSLRAAPRVPPSSSAMGRQQPKDNSNTPQRR